MLVGSEPQDDCDHSPKGSWLARPNKGGVKWVSTPMSKGMTMPVYLSDVEYSHPPEEGPLPPVERWLHTLH